MYLSICTATILSVPGISLGWGYAPVLINEVNRGGESSMLSYLYAYLSHRREWISKPLGRCPGVLESTKGSRRLVPNSAFFGPPIHFLHYEPVPQYHKSNLFAIQSFRGVLLNLNQVARHVMA